MEGWGQGVKTVGVPMVGGVGVGTPHCGFRRVAVGFED